MPKRRALIQQVATGFLVVLIAVGVVFFLVTPTREAILGWFKPPEKMAESKTPARPVELIRDAHGHDGLHISAEALKSLEVNPCPAGRPCAERELPPQIGTVNYDPDHLFTIRPRFAGEMISFHPVQESLYPGGPDR